MRGSLRCFLSSVRTNDSGVSAIEFALVSSIFFTLIFGILIYGSYFASLSLINHVAFEAARATVAGLSDDERSTLAHAKADELIASLSGVLDASAVTVNAAATGAGTYAVTVHYHFTALGLMNAISILPLPPADQTATFEISHGGY